MAIQSFLRKYKLKKGLEKVQTNFNYKGFEAVEKVGICFERNAHRNEILQYADNLKQLGKEVHLLEYIPLRKKEIEKESVVTDLPWFCKSDVNWVGYPNSVEIQKFKTIPFGVYLDLINAEEHCIDFISSTIKADFKIGSHLRPDLKYNMLVAFKQEGFKTVFKEIDYYLNFINQHAQ